jgi:hypothetical protein
MSLAGALPSALRKKCATLVVFPNIVEISMAYPLLARCAALSAGILAVAAIAMAPARAMDRPIPPEAKRGELAIAQYPGVLLNGKARRVSAAARIRNADNLIVMPSVLGTSKYAVRYTEDFQGEIDRVWILTAEEASRAVPSAARQP